MKIIYSLAMIVLMVSILYSNKSSKANFGITMNKKIDYKSIIIKEQQNRIEELEKMVKHIYWVFETAQ